MFGYYTSILILCWISLLVMCILVYENNRISHENKSYLYLTYVLIAVSAFSEWYGVYLDGRTDMPGWVLILVKCADYILTPAAGGVLVMQMHLHNRWQKVLNAVMIANAVFQIIAVPNGWTVSIDGQNHYTHGPLFPVYVGICLVIIVLMIVQFILYGKTFKRQNQFSLYSTMILVMTAIILQVTLTGYRTAYIGMTFGAAFLFIHHTEFSQLAADETLAEQRVQLMLSQIKPHFLYNMLGSIEALCVRDPGAAMLATRKFSKYLRGNMNSISGENLVPFETELQHTELYLDLEKIRFGDALQVEYDITAGDFLIPPLTLEPIVENAVRHGIRKNADGRGTVSISTNEQRDLFTIQVTDDGPGYDPAKTPADGDHIGIRNVSERLDRICGGSLSISPGAEKGTVVTIYLPKTGENEKC